MRSDWLIDGCKLDFSCPQSLYVHRKRVHRNEEFECKVPGCTKKYKQSAGLWRHVQSSHRNNDMRYPCTVPGCDKDFSAESSVVAHVRDFHEKGAGLVHSKGVPKSFQPLDVDLCMFAGFILVLSRSCAIIMTVVLSHQASRIEEILQLT